ncbi:MAG: helix-turn-helix transcriptional regulator [Bacteroidaceae bacterium]|nr:helix-turn-helix transcriptional regulator [Bacteroidaceae bacterium]
MSPRIAIISPDTLAAIGLGTLIEEMMPAGEVCLYASLEELAQQTHADYNAAADPFVHYFISAGTLLSHARFFLPRRHKTIVLAHGAELSALPEGFRTVDTHLPRPELLRALAGLHHNAHGPHSAHPLPRPTTSSTDENTKKSLLTRRETDVLRCLVRGLTNKGTAEALGVGLTTVISHRDNLTRKLGTRSLAALTVYAVSHGIVGVEEI